MSPAKAAQACIDRFHGAAYEPGKRDCARLGAHLLHQYGHGCPPMKGQSYRTEVEALRALRKAGFRDLIAAVDALGLTRIVPAYAMTGDLIALPHDDFGATLTVAVGNGEVLGFQDGRGKIIKPLALAAAWRVPCPR